MLAATTPLRAKLMAGMLLVGSTVLFLTAAAFATYEFLSFRRSLVEQITTLGGVVAANSTAALAFDNEDDARETLAALRAEPQIVAAALFDASGRLFARYPADIPDQELPASVGADEFDLLHALGLPSGGAGRQRAPGHAVPAIEHEHVL
jgi:hypothetical protein